MADVTKDQERLEEESQQKDQMCCEGGMTAAEHRAESQDGKCCTD